MDHDKRSNVEPQRGHKVEQFFGLAISPRRRSLSFWKRFLFAAATHVGSSYACVGKVFVSAAKFLLLYFSFSLSFSIANLFRKMIKKMNITRWRDPSGEEEKQLLSTQQQLCPGGRSKEDFLCAPFEDEQPGERERESKQSVAQENEKNDRSRRDARAFIMRTI